MLTMSLNSKFELLDEMLIYTIFRIFTNLFKIIFRVSIRVQDEQSGIWLLLPPFNSSMDEEAGVNEALRVIYSVDSSDAEAPFRMDDNMLTLADRTLTPGEFNLTIRAHLSRRHPLGEGPTLEEIAVREVQHALRVVIMHADDGPQRYPVFERFSYEFEVGRKIFSIEYFQTYSD